MTQRLQPEEQAAYLGALAATGRRLHAADVAGVPSEVVAELIRADEAFAARVQNAENRYNELLETEVHRRGVDGYDEPVFGKDGQVGTRKRYSDQLLITLLKKRMPAYREKAADVSVQAGGVLVVNNNSTSVEEWKDKHDADRNSDSAH